jgi:hypothetical protein
MPYAKMIYVFGFLPSARAPVCQSAGSFAKAPLCQSASLPERQFARAPVSPERQFRQSASFAKAPVC